MTRSFLLLAGLIAAVPASGQEIGIGEVDVGSEYESYLRNLQVLGKVGPYPWSLRAFSASEIEGLLPGDSTYAWGSRRVAIPSASDGRLQLIRPGVEIIYNSAFPYGENDGPVWAGRGVTTVLTGGVSARYGPLTASIAPTIYFVQNASFELMRQNLPQYNPFADARKPIHIDLPQRFGDESFTSFNPGQSSVRLDLLGVAAGISTANQHWGPAVHHPLILGNNASGFVHVFAGTSRPTDIYIGRIHARALWGHLGQSAYSPVSGDSTSRFAAGLVAVFTPRGLPTLELGGARFFHTPWTDSGLETEFLLMPFEGFLKAGIPGKDIIPDEHEPNRDFDPDNQLASIFFRWLFPRNQVELYGEYARDDHSWDARDLLLEPEHNSGYMLGLRKAWELSDERIVSLGGEILNTQMTPLDRVRPQAPFYVHGWTRQGHTNRGQLLGSAAGYGGAAALVKIDYYQPAGRLTAEWARTLRQESDLFWMEGELDERGLDVQHSLGVEGLLFRNGWDFTGGITGVYNFNRNFGEDVVNLNVSLGVRTPI